MVQGYHDPKGNLVGYKISGKKDQLEFKVAMAEFRGELSSLGSHMQDLKGKFDDMSKKLGIAIEHFHETLLTFAPKVNKITGEGGKPGLETRMDCVELEQAKITVRLDTGIKIIAWEIGIGIALMAGIEAYFKYCR